MCIRDRCCAQYHGANRLGGISLLGALYGGRVAAKSACEQADVVDLSCATPVSYTHLDVYKRQALSLLGFLGESVEFTPYLHLWKIGSE